MEGLDRGTTFGDRDRGLSNSQGLVPGAEADRTGGNARQVEWERGPKPS